MAKNLYAGAQNLSETFLYFKIADQKIDLMEQQDYFEKLPSKIQPFFQ